jgi:hypothetical protein
MNTIHHYQVTYTKVSFDTDEYYSSLSTEASYREKRPCKRDIQKVTNRGKRDLLPEAQ